MVVDINVDVDVGMYYAAVVGIFLADSYENDHFVLGGSDHVKVDDDMIHDTADHVHLRTTFNYSKMILSIVTSFQYTS